MSNPFKNDMPEHNLGKEYINHKVFNELTEYSDFYSRLSFLITGFVSQGTKSIMNLDTSFFSSIEGTLDSINEILSKGRINDSYALLRKYYDSTIINIYFNLYLEDNFDFKNMIVEEIDKWRNGTGSIPHYQTILSYIENSSKLDPITKLLKKDDRYKKIRDRCNNHLHYNFFQNAVYNNNQVHISDRIEILDTFSKDLKNLFIQHFAYIFYLRDHYMMSSDYIDSLELGITPEGGSQYYVAPFIQGAFDEIIKKERPYIAEEIKSNTVMNIK